VLYHISEAISIIF